MPLSIQIIKEFDKLRLELEKKYWEIVGAYWVYYAQTNTPHNLQKKIHITALGYNHRSFYFYNQSLEYAIKELNLKFITVNDIIIAGDDEFHSGVYHLEEKIENKLLNNVYFKDNFIKELYIFKCIESESTAKYPPRLKITTYKYFKELKFKDDFLSGKIWVGTLSGFRKIENENQGDKDEGLTFYNTSQSFNHDDWKELSQKNPSVGQLISFGGVFNGTINISNLTVQSPDLYTVCFSKKRDDKLFKNDFGEFCVKINDTEKFFITLMISAMEQMYKIKYCEHGSVDYTKKSLTDLSEKTYSVFHKPEKYSWQEEYRFSWATEQNHEIHPFLLDASDFISKGMIEDII
ncbi:hypothetical protein [Klebsiella quasipneumoniae]|uniref:hypothetical protein n=1 Tax=Klebsiella quasipneumoniae TaxID=1463165 RepID=UPI000DE758F9|nr:hypothetical protein [Klebsiella quasipneumoniae]SSI00394.1 Uncharacterised protein [Klebsiella quasipneumoniae]